MTIESQRTSHMPATSTTAVSVHGLVKTYGRPEGGTFNAVDGLDFEVRMGEIFSILGPNGAGKTTTLEIVEGLKRPTAGTVSVLGLDVTADGRAVRTRIGVQLQSGGYFEHLRLGEILELFGSFYPTRRDPGELLEIVGLADKRKALVRELSGGQAQRFSIVAALVNDPEVVFLDEPTTGLDPQARRHLWDVISDLNRRLGKTVVLTTHYMEEAEVLSDRIGIVDAGRMVALDTPDALIGSLPAGHHVTISTSHSAIVDELRMLPDVIDAAVEPSSQHTFRLAVSSPARVVAALFEWAARTGNELTDVAIAAASLEDVFLATTGRRLRD